MTTRKETQSKESSSGMTHRDQCDNMQLAEEYLRQVGGWEYTPHHIKAILKKKIKECQCGTHCQTRFKQVAKNSNKQ